MTIVELMAWHLEQASHYQIKSDAWKQLAIRLTNCEERQEYDNHADAHAIKAEFHTYAVALLAGLV